MHFPKNIIIVEDEAITQQYLIDIVEYYGVNVVACFENALHVIDTLKMVSCDMILMDINIKGSTDGIQLTKEILNQYALPIVFISAYSDEKTMDEVLNLLPYGFITKPFSKKEIFATLQIAYKRFLTDERRLSKESESNDIIIDKNYTFSLGSSTLFYKRKAVKLNIKQNILVESLVKELDRTVTFEQLIHNIWGTEIVSSAALRTMVYKIRQIAPEFPLHSYSKKGYYLTSS